MRSKIYYEFPIKVNYVIIYIRCYLIVRREFKTVFFFFTASKVQFLIIIFSPTTPDHVDSIMMKGVDDWHLENINGFRMC